MRAIHYIAPDQPFQNILEVGGGQGGLTTLLYPRSQVTNIDLNPNTLKLPVTNKNKFILCVEMQLSYPLKVSLLMP
jgi:16S rRNA A1518/A1519 N6-dimethyltransferase RsmA/KsgA/DIM1 with predicted DNA glycosylase/AP lyase activity